MSAWRKKAVCNGMERSIFFPDLALGKQSLAFREKIRQAKAICLGCSVRRQCLEEALNTESVGVWGGTTEEERKPMLIRRGGNKRTCRYCGSSFRTLNPDRRYCSDQCRKVWAVTA